MLLAVIEVDPQNDWLDYLNVVLAAVGGFAGAIAIVIALRAQRAADRTVAAERERVLELEVLRELVNDLDEADLAGKAFADPSHMRRYSLRLDLLSTRLPSWDLVSELKDRNAAIDFVGLGEDWRSAKVAQDEANKGRSDSFQEYAELRDRLLMDPPNSPDVRQDMGLKLQRLVEYRSGLEVREGEAARRQLDIEVQAAERLAEKLAYDVHQAIGSRVLTGQGPQLSWWKRKWWYRV